MLKSLMIVYTIINNDSLIQNRNFENNGDFIFLVRILSFLSYKLL